jgi:hypothetical protein
MIEGVRGATGVSPVGGRETLYLIRHVSLAPL